MAGARLLDVPGDEPGQGAARRALRLDLQPQLCRAPGTGRADAPDVAGNGCGGRRHRPADRRTRPALPGSGARGMTPFTSVEGKAYPLPLRNVDTDLIIPAAYLK